jgi:hypothetical protein
MPTSHTPAWEHRYAFDPEARLYVRRDGGAPVAYSDGDHEEERLAAIIDRATDLSVLSMELRRGISDWFSRYHLSPLRANLLRPLSSLFQGTTLELGAGCGAITRFLGECGGTVVAVEGSRRRAAIAASRCRDLQNVRVVCDRAEAFPADVRFDAVTLIGVLEWARRFGEGADPVQTLLERCRQYIGSRGCLVLAIENQLGLKYFAGYSEDHLGVPMRGIEDGYDASSPVTFGRGELLNRLRSAGFDRTALFLPLPDYKLPMTIITPQGLEDSSWQGVLANLLASSPIADYQHPAVPVFAIEQAWKVVARNRLAPDLANSFLVVAAARDSTTWPAESSHALAFHYGHERRPIFARETVLMHREGRLTVAKRPIGPAPASAIEDFPVRARCFEEPMQLGMFWLDALAQVVNRPGWRVSDVAEWAAPWLATLARELGVIAKPGGGSAAGRLVDAIPLNLVRTSHGEFRFFDLEWESSSPLEEGFIRFRGLFHSLGRLRTVAAPDPSVPLQCVAIVDKVVAELGFAGTAADLDRYCEMEAQLQFWAAGADPDEALAAIRARQLSIRHGMTWYADLESRAAREAAERGTVVALLQDQIRERDEALQRMRSDLIGAEARLGHQQQQLHAQLEEERRKQRAESRRAQEATDLWLDEVAKIRRSRSWRAMEPLRRLAEAGRRLAALVGLRARQ